LRLLIGNKNYSTWSLRPWLVLRHFNISFEEELLRLDGEGWKQNLIDKTPTGRVPVLVDDDLQLPETIAIIEYVADTNPHKPIWPSDIRSRALARAAAAEMHAGFQKIRNAAPMNLRAHHPGRIDLSEVQSDLDRLEVLLVGLIERSGGPFLFDDFSAADAMFAPMATRLRTYMLPTSPALTGYIDAIYGLPAFVAWREQALLEPWVVEEDEIDFIQGKSA
jgi:glutathione S-transferase